MKHCRVCLETTHEHQQITHYQTWGNRMTILENVPAEVCTQCGETLFSSKVVKKIEQIARSGATPKRMEQVPVYDFADVELANDEA